MLEIRPTVAAIILTLASHVALVLGERVAGSADCPIRVLAVEGDSCKSLADANGLTIYQFARSNPELKSCSLQAGQVYCVDPNIPNFLADGKTEWTDSPDGSCAGSGAHSCLGSIWGDCCASSGYCGSNDDYCGAGCNPDYGLCSPSSPGGQVCETVTVQLTNYETVYLQDTSTGIEECPAVTILTVSYLYDTVTETVYTTAPRL
jgi:hypothetical protein